MNRLIKTDQDYQEALVRIEALMDAAAGSAEADELELLSALVEMYEEKQYPIAPPDPVEAIRFRMEQLGLSQKDLVFFLGSKSKVSEVLSRKRPLTLSMMRSLNHSLGISAEVLLQEPGGSFPESTPDMKWHKFPVAELVKRCWLPKTAYPEEKAEELMREFIDEAGGMGAVQSAAFRRSMSPRLNKKTDAYALTAWCLRIRILARKSPLKTSYTKGTVTLKFMKETAKLSYFDNGPVLAKEYLGKQGIHLIIVHHLPKTYLDGAAMLLPDGTPVIGMTLRYDRLDNFWFCLLHELAHVANHLTSSEVVIVDDLDLRGSEADMENRIEKEADEMAMEASIPQKMWNQQKLEGRVAADTVIALAEKLKIHPAIVAGRIRFERRNYRLLSQLVGNGEVRNHFPQICTTENR